MLKLPCVIMCGGKSSRMRQDKSLLKFGEHPSLAKMQIEKFNSLCEDAYISTKNTKKFNFKTKFIKDKYEIYAPSVSIISAFEQLQIENIFFISVDTPYFGEEELQKLYSHTGKGYDAIVPIQDNKIHPLCAIYNKNSISTLKKLNKNKQYKLQVFLQNINTKFVNFTNKKAFTNLNYYDEYLKHCKIPKET